jgi:hypothetical protein
MWLCLNNSFLSIVQPDASDPFNRDGGMLLVRARRSGDIEQTFPTAIITTVSGRDYQFRAYIDRAEVAQCIAATVMAVDYPNFKGSVKDPELHEAMACVWGVMAQIQKVPPFESLPRKRKRFAVNPRNPYASD